MKLTLLLFQPQPLKVQKKYFENPAGVKLSHNLDFQSSVGIAEGHPPAIKCRWIQEATHNGELIVEWDGFELYKMEDYVKGQEEEKFKTLLKNSYYSFQAYFRKAQKEVSINIPELPEISPDKLEECFQGLLRNLHRVL